MSARSFSAPPLQARELAQLLGWFGIGPGDTRAVAGRSLSRWLGTEHAIDLATACAKWRSAPRSSPPSSPGRGCGDVSRATRSISQRSAWGSIAAPPRPRSGSRSPPCSASRHSTSVRAMARGATGAHRLPILCAAQRDSRAGSPRHGRRRPRLRRAGGFSHPESAAPVRQLSRARARRSSTQGPRSGGIASDLPQRRRPVGRQRGVVTEQGLVTSRRPDDLPAFNRAGSALFSRGPGRKRSAG